MEPATKTQKVYLALKDLISSMKPGTKLGHSIKGFAKKFNVSHVTVSAAVDLLKKEGLLIAKRKVGLIVHPGKSETPSDSAPVLFLHLREEVGGEFEKDILQGAVSLVERSGGSVITKSVLRDMDDVVSLVREGVVRHVIVSFFNPFGMEDAVRRLLALGANVCAVDEAVEGVDSVFLDNRGAGRLLGRYLFTGERFRSVLLVRRYLYAQAETDREEGIREILDELRVPHKRVFWLSSYSGEIDRQLPAFLRAGFEFDAVFSHTAGSAAFIRDLIKEETGKDTHVVAFDTKTNLEMHKVSGVIVSPGEMGARAVRLLHERSLNPFAEPRHEVVEGSMFLG